MQKIDKYSIGLIMGVLLPFIFGVIYVDTMNLWYAFKTFQFEAGGVLSKLLLVSVFPDLALVFIGYTLQLWRVSKGLLMGTFPFLLASLIVSL